MNKLALLVVPALVLQIIATTQFDSDLVGLKRAFLIVSYALLLCGVLGIRGRVVRVLAFIGVLMNALPIAANGGLMPTTQDAVEEAIGERPELRSSPRFTKGIVLPRDEIHLYPLSDHLVIGPLNHNVFSPGDIVLALAAFAFLGGGLVGAIHDLTRRTDGGPAPPTTLAL